MEFLMGTQLLWSLMSTQFLPEAAVDQYELLISFNKV